MPTAHVSFFSSLTTCFKANAARAIFARSYIALIPKAAEIVAPPQKSGHAQPVIDVISNAHGFISWSQFKFTQWLDGSVTFKVVGNPKV
jgi:hypothetical protein